MRCLGSLCGLVIGPLALTTGAGLFLGSLACLAGACAWAGNGRPGIRETEDGAGAAGAPEPARRPRRRGRAL
jgi:hypothetical protein